VESIEKAGQALGAMMALEEILNALEEAHEAAARLHDAEWSDDLRQSIRNFAYDNVKPYREAIAEELGEDYDYAEPGLR
jgi:hypothetical protein